MACVEWEIKAREFANCNCAYGCPCQFNALPTHGHCMAVVGYQIDERHFGGIPLNGLALSISGSSRGQCIRGMELCK